MLRGLSRADLRALERASLSREAWSAVLRVSVETASGPAADPVAGSYTVGGGAVRFAPVLPFEGGRRYVVQFNPAAAPDHALDGVPALTTVLSTPAPPRTAPVHVTAVYPSGPTVPANLLRMYVEFSAPMGSAPAEDYITLLNEDRQPIEGALLPLDTGLWNTDHTRFTILFDPGRVKRGILPNRAMGRPLHAGGSFTLVVNRAWPDAQGQPLAAEYRQDYRVGAAIERPLAPAAWTIEAPPGGSRDPLRLTFPAALDRGLALRAFTVLHGDKEVAGDVAVDPGELRWAFTPREPWPAGAYAIAVLPALEDPSGNRVGRAFESLDEGDDTRQAPARILFAIR